VTNVEFWQPDQETHSEDISQFKTFSASDTTTCIDTGVGDNKLQRIALKVTVGIFTRTITILKRGVVQ